MLPIGVTVVEALTLLLASLGVICLLFASVGIVRLANVIQRMHPASIASSLGIFLILVSAAIHDPTTGNWLRVVLLISLFYLTAPIATTAMARAAWRKTSSEARSGLTVDDMTDPQWTLDYKRRNAETNQDSITGIARES
jgi:multicomponent Na+:H+ antiporter subunit G